MLIASRWGAPPPKPHGSLGSLGCASHASKRTNVALVALVGVFLAAAAAACGSSSNSTGSGASSSTSTSTGTSTSTSSTSSGISIAQACADSAHANCTERDTCSTGSFLNDHTYGSEADCETRQQLTCNTSLLANGTGQTPAGVEACVAAYSTYTCTTFLDDDPPAACVPPAGKLANGAGCGTSAQCMSTFCAVSEYEVCGTCATLPVAGATCLVDADCGRGLDCAIPTGATMGTCVAYGAANAACLTGSLPCAAGLACVGDDETTGVKGTCEPQGAVLDAACDADRKAAANCYGDLGLVCIPAKKGSGVGTCQSITLAAAGSPCGDIGSDPITGYAECAAGGLCKKASATATSGTCVAPAADGAPCDSNPLNGPPCLPPAKCVATADGGTAGTCVVPDAPKCP